MSRSDYLILLGALGGFSILLFYFCYRAFRSFRFVDGTATSKIRSAAQGHVELKGLGEWMSGDSIVSPFSNSRCIWYHCTIEKREKSGKRSSWSNISDECSDTLFRLVDDTGWCIVDPDHAQVIPESDITWYGHNTDYRAKPPAKAQWLHISMGNYRFREQLIRPATSIYALGEFSSIENNATDEYIARQTEDIVKQWKLQPKRYLEQYDFDQNGRIQKQEWKAIRSAARKQVLAKINNQSSEHHLLSAPQDGSRPYILSATAEEDLVARKKTAAYFSMTCVFLIFVALVVLSSLRPPFPS
ncbi:E3 ubiquitin ligase family protein [Gammaproteobacteria bacterium]|nr:E3 ubiquitin ligase family protein [Gammaproteobacteria bacterium]